MSIGVFGPHDDEDFKAPTVEELNFALAALQSENKQLKEAIQFLKHRLDEHKIPYFDDVGEERFKKHPYEMTKEELREANKTVTARLKPKAINADKVPMPSYDSLNKIYTDRVNDIKPGGLLDKVLQIILVKKEEGNKNE
jgi:uncharacterized coiled-coil protein SlyX